MNKNVRRKDHQNLLLSIQDPKIFARIVERYQKPFMNKVISITRNKQDAQDIVQEAFVKMYLGAAKFELRESAAFSSWAYKVLMNTCFTHYKKGKRHRNDISYDDSVGLVERESIQEETLIDRFLLVLSKIPVDCAKLLKLLVVEGKSYNDLSRIIGITEGALRVRIHRAKSHFRRALQQNPNL